MNLSKLFLVSSSTLNIFGSYPWQSDGKEALLEECTTCWLFFSSFVMKKLLLGIYHLCSSRERTDWLAAASALTSCQVSESPGPFRDTATVPAWLHRGQRLPCPAGMALLQALSTCLSLILGFVAVLSLILRQPQNCRCALLLTTLLPSVNTRLWGKLMAPANSVHLNTEMLHLQVQWGILVSEACASCICIS